MFVPDHAGAPAKEKTMRHVVLELTVNNHPGVMSHVCGLFSRRAYNVEGIACMPVGDGATSRIWLLVEDQRRLEQMITQVGKLEDVRQVERHGGDHPLFAELGRFFAA
ncbi:acetolactate synthase small subunit [Desulfocurvus sp.]|jgi:acetolactate synthase-1/3 small subunit|uniref:acetolactate synthase small subunit n=1 Tax=Desulfocurvus sp. TaxID=2871698 RepID=UPI0025BD0B35|nr:acetolactate synthase small subunit [Desulfocurvus sp.]MCK9239378.1 acetolactate synthase small subunit [Desulfocurvus sp.]